METKVKGIKCDKPGCGFIDETVSWEDVEKVGREWVDKPCPKCGSNLLTQVDFDSTKRLIFVVTELEKLQEEVDLETSTKTPVEKISVHSDGTGNKKLSTDSMNFDFSPETIAKMEVILKDPQGREMIKQTLIAQNN